jgi:hypothetical protein
MLALVLFWYWFALGSAVFHWMGISVETVASYSLCIPVGLILESAIHNPTPIFGHKRQPNLIRAIPRPLRQTAIAIGFLFIVLILSRDRFLPRLFLFTFVPLLYAMLLCTGHFFPSLFCRKLFKGFRVERILLIGNPERAVKIRNWLAAEHEYGFRTAGILTDRPNAGSAWPTFLGTPDQLEFLNVLSGEMNVVGARPHMVEHDHRFSALLGNYRVRSFSKPGIIGLAQIRGFRGETTTLREISARLDSDLGTSKTGHSPWISQSLCERFC